MFNHPLKIPLSFKGPKGQIQKLFSEDLVFQATKLLLNNKLSKWNYKQPLELINAVIKDDKNSYKLSINWPITTSIDELVGSCACELPKPCVHLAALVIEAKTKLEQLPPFTQQIQASKNIAETFSNWMMKQNYDPYPNMARHRLLYILDFDADNKKFTISLHKAYISTEARYSLKSKLDTSIIKHNILPKFITISDQKILHNLSQNSVGEQHIFTLESELDEEILTDILLTNRCIWKTCYRSPLEFTQNVSVLNPSSIQVTGNLFLSISSNSVVSKSQIYTQATKIDVSKTHLMPHLSLSSYEICINAKEKHYFDFDIAKISFIYKNQEFNFADLSVGKIIPDSLLLAQMAGYLRQIENLDSIYAHFEKTIIQDFHLNDRYIEDNFIFISCLLRGLQLEGWHITIANNFRLNQYTTDNWYAQINSHNHDKQHKNKGWFDLELGVKIDGQTINLLPYLVKAIRTGKITGKNIGNINIKLDDGKNISINNNTLKQILATLGELYDETSLNAEGQLTLATTQLLRIKQLQESINTKPEVNINWQGDTWLQQKAQELNSNIGLTNTPIPENLNVELRHYQQTGFSWLQFLNKYHLGGILADDMGLGKTLQVLTHILYEKNSGNLTSPCLIVVPTSLLSNWQNEIRKFTPSLSSLSLSGVSRHKQYQLLNNIDIIIMSYGVMVCDIKVLVEFNFHMLVLDEAQAIKNAKTKTAKIVNSLNAKQRLCLTGTPIENHLGELWSLFNFVMPGFLGSLKQFEKIYRIPIEKHNDKNRQKDLSKRVAAFMLRRTKSEVAKELPDKTEIIQIIELNEAQTNLYETIRITMSDEIKQAFRNTHKPQNNIIIGNALLRLRQVCCHPALLKLATIDKSYESAKLNWLTTVLPNMLEEGRKILLFSSFTTMLDIIAEHLHSMNITSIKLTGKTPANKRGGLIQKFQQGAIPVFLISLKAGGAGINLTTADTVIHFDPWWNPAAENQASDRAHRIGQDKNVFVYKLISKGTVEQKIQNMQEHKHALAQSIFDHKGNISTILGNNNWQELLKPIE
ncbi:MAG: DEAD/DEAH box helicase [Proteobacteria bacterium]|nr:DEAD/DEAH box helicase [Pseudomonadota bacterium]